jgi:hypothetical protein
MKIRDTLKRKMANLKQAIHLLLDPPVVDKIDRYRYSHQIPSRTKAIIELIEWALSHPPPRAGKKKSAGGLASAGGEE